MSFLRPASFLRPTVLRPALSTAPRARFQVRFATQDYGSGEGNPAGENPQEQGKNSRGDLEHPGPSPPKAAQGNSQQSSSHAQDSGKQAATGGDGSGGQSAEGSAGGKGSKGAQPKILNENPPSAEDESEGVKQHNEEMEQRAEKAYEQVSNKDAKKDKVPPQYWSGTGGRDADP